MRRAGAPVGGRLPSSTLRGAKKRIIATHASSEFELNNCNHRRLTFSNRNKNRCFSRFRLEPLARRSTMGLRRRVPLQNPNRQLETIRNRHNPFTINQMTFSNRPKKTEVRRAPKSREKARAREILRLWAGSSQETGRKNQRAGPPLRMTGERGWSKGNGNSDGKARTPAGRPRYERQRSLDA
jgi:hypothetical protein